MKRLPKKKIIKLPIAGITITLAGKGGAVTGAAPGQGIQPGIHVVAARMNASLHQTRTEGKSVNETYRDALYTMLLAHTQAGIDVTSQAYLTGVQAVVDAIASI